MNLTQRKQVHRVVKGRRTQTDNEKRFIFLIKLRTRLNKNFFGHFVHGEMHGNTEGRIISKVWMEVPFLLHGIKVLHFQITPNELQAMVKIERFSEATPFDAGKKCDNKYERHLKKVKSRLMKEHCRIVMTKLLSMFKSRTTILLNQLHGTQSRIVWENAYEEAELKTKTVNENSYFSDGIPACKITY